jgi:hypothetical protein
MNQAAMNELQKLRVQHHSLGLMIGELETVVSTMDGLDLINAIDQISARYGTAA